MTSKSLCECPHCESAQHQHGESHSPSPPEHTSSKQNILVLRLHECTKKKTSTIPLIQLFVLHTQVTPDNVICPTNVELELVASLDFILDQYIQNTKKRCKLQLNAIVATGYSSASSVQKLATTLTCLQGFKMKTCWLQQTLQRKKQKLLRDFIFSHCQTSREILSRSATNNKT